MKKTTASIAIALLLACWSAISAYPQSKAMQKAVSTSRSNTFKSGVFSVLAVKMNGDTVACVNSRVKMVPASNMKLITTGISLLKLGPDYRFETKLGYSGEIEGGTLKGNLYIIGGGDPTTGSSSECAESLHSLFGKWKGILSKAGIKRIDGNIIGDPRFFEMMSQENFGWSYEDIGNEDGAGINGLNFYENKQTFYVTPAPTPGGKNFVRPRYPETPWMTVGNRSLTSNPNTPNTLSYVNTGFGPYGEIRGYFPVNGRGATMTCDNEFGAYTCAFYFFRYLASAGITVTGTFGDVSPQGFIRTDLHYSEFGTMAPPVDELTVLGSTFSPTLAEIARDTNKKSNNFFAETLMHTMGQTLGGSAEYGTCCTVVENALASIGAKTGDSCRIFDGSGLSRKNYASADFFVRYLKAMTKTKVYQVFLESLANPMDRKSTITGYFSRYPDDFRSRVYCKTGSMNGVRCYSGYILPSNGNPAETIVFSVLTNNVTAGTYAVSGALQELLAAIASENY